MFDNEGSINFTEFLDIFSLKKNDEFNEVDVKNAFRLLSKEYDKDKAGKIKLERVKEILTEMNIVDIDIVQLTNQLQAECDDEGYFDFEKFVSSAF